MDARPIQFPRIINHRSNEPQLITRHGLHGEFGLTRLPWLLKVALADQPLADRGVGVELVIVIHR